MGEDRGGGSERKIVWHRNAASPSLTSPMLGEGFQCTLFICDSPALRGKGSLVWVKWNERTYFLGTVAGSIRDIGTAASITILTATGIGTARWADTIRERAATAMFIGHNVGSVLARCWRALAHRRF